MAEANRNTQVGSAGGTVINVDLRPINHAVSKKVTLSANYTTAYPPGYPSPPDMTGAEVKAGKLNYPKTINSGTTIALLGAEADALVAAGKASYA